MVNDKALEAVAKAIYEEDDVWSAAFPWPKMGSKEQSADNYRRIARAAISAYLTAAKEGGEPGWQDISTAPSDGGNILVIGGRRTEAEIAPADGDWWRCIGGMGKPTHWRPLPSPPASKGGEE